MIDSWPGLLAFGPPAIRVPPEDALTPIVWAPPAMKIPPVELTRKTPWVPLFSTSMVRLVLPFITRVLMSVVPAAAMVTLPLVVLLTR